MENLIDAVYALHGLFPKGRRLSTAEACERLGCSRATFMRTKRFMSERLGAPIRYDSRAKRYSYDRDVAFELPGLWFSAAEMVALSTLAALLEQLEPGVVRERMETCRRAIGRVAGKELDTDELARRIRLFPMNARSVDPGLFVTVAEALLDHRRLAFEYRGARDTAGKRRTVSPQQLVGYRDNWYLDGWCHEAEALRTFSLHRIRVCVAAPGRPRRVARNRLEQHFASGYGIWAGKPTATAKLRFTGTAAMYAGEEQWHPRQTHHAGPHGSVVVSFPYSSSAELARDILRWADETEIVDPPDLRDEVCKLLKKAALHHLRVSRSV